MVSNYYFYLKWHSQTPLGFWDRNGSPNLGQTTRLYNNQQKKRTCKIVDFAILDDLRIKLKESKKRINTSTWPRSWKY